MKNLLQIFVRLVDENVDVWRPVMARHLGDKLYQIVEQPYDRELEVWEFEPGAIVVCEWTELSDGPSLTAIEQSEDPHRDGSSETRSDV